MTLYSIIFEGLFKISELFVYGYFIYHNPVFAIALLMYRQLLIEFFFGCDE